MDVRTAVMERRSIRKFKPDPVPFDIIRKIIDEARWAPSWGNVQPWEFYVVTGRTLEKFRGANRKAFLANERESPEIRMPQEWSKTMKTRYMEVGKSVLTSLTIARDDAEARKRYYADMFSLFGAPCLILTCLDKSLVFEYAMLDVGLVMQTICLLAHEKNLGTIMLAASVRYPQLLRELLQIPKEEIIAIGTVIGYPDWNSPVNDFERKRADINELVTWVS